jgi:hypothetical protein
MAELLSRRDLIRNPTWQGRLLACRLRLRLLQLAVLAARVPDEASFCRCDLRELAEDLCGAADLLLHPQGRSVRLEAPEAPIEADCIPRDLTWLLLELICNAARHCPGEEITLRLSPRRAPRKSKRAAVVLSVECAGSLDLEALHASMRREGAGAAALLGIANEHRAPLLWLEQEGRSVAALRLPARSAHPPAAWHEPPDFVELLSDQCSPVYIALAACTGTGGRLRRG